MKIRHVLTAGSAALILRAGVALAQPAAQVGSLSCDVSPGFGMIIEQKQTMHCVFTPIKGDPEPYLGHIDDFGLAIGASGEGHLVWGVLAASTGVPKGALTGTYVGVGAQASVGPGVGANALVGGAGRAFSLQPLSIQGQPGFNFAAGVRTVTLVTPPPK